MHITFIDYWSNIYSINTIKLSLEVEIQLHMYYKLKKFNLKTHYASVIWAVHNKTQLHDSTLFKNTIRFECSRQIIVNFTLYCSYTGTYLLRHNNVQICYFKTLYFTVHTQVVCIIQCVIYFCWMCVMSITHHNIK